jgi:hypothetical protein
MTSIQWILLILCIAAVLLYWKALESSTEGYIGPVQPVQGQLPKATQISYIPRDSASATTVNPTLAKPDYREWANARQGFQFFLEAYTPEGALGSGKQGEIAAMLLDAPRFLQKIEQFILNPEAIPSRDILERAIEAEALANAMRYVGPADPNSSLVGGGTAAPFIPCMNMTRDAM